MIQILQRLINREFNYQSKITASKIHLILIINNRIFEDENEEQGLVDEIPETEYVTKNRHNYHN